MCWITFEQKREAAKKKAIHSAPNEECNCYLLLPTFSAACSSLQKKKQQPNQARRLVDVIWVDLRFAHTYVWSHRCWSEHVVGWMGEDGKSDNKSIFARFFMAHLQAVLSFCVLRMFSFVSLMLWVVKFIHGKPGVGVWLSIHVGWYRVVLCILKTSGIRKFHRNNVSLVFSLKA